LDKMARTVAENIELQNLTSENDIESMAPSVRKPIWYRSATLLSFATACIYSHVLPVYVLLMFSFKIDHGIIHHLLLETRMIRVWSHRERLLF
jgi:hypothetical protein